MSEKSTSKFISLILRHHPEVIGITLDEHGWADVDELIEGVGRTREIDRELLEKIVAEDEKQRYSFNEDKTLIRANQGHSVPVDVELEKKTPPVTLWHGTGEKYVESIEEQGLLPKARLSYYSQHRFRTRKRLGFTKRLRFNERLAFCECGSGDCSSRSSRQ